MKRSPTIEIIMSLAAREAIAAEFGEIEPEHLFVGILKFSEIDMELVKDNFAIEGSFEFLKNELDEVRAVLNDRGIDSTALRRQVRAALGKGGSPFNQEAIHRSLETKLLFEMAGELAGEEEAGLVTACHYLRAILKNPTARLAGLIGIKPLATMADGDSQSPAPGREEPPGNKQETKASADWLSLGGLTDTLKGLSKQLRGKIFGQDHAVQAFVEGLFNAEVVAAADKERRKPKGLFVFAGPPGVGKTFLAESGSRALGRPFKRFDMSSFSSHEDVNSLIGMHRSYKGAHPGLLTEFVEKNPHAVLLFDEIEKAHLNTIHLFLQVLDGGAVEDKFTEKSVEFRDTIMIFTTNAGKVLYDQPNASTVYLGSAGLHRKTILDALENEIDQRTGKPFFPPAICSRLATGYPVLFNHLGINELNKVAAGALQRTAGLLEKQYLKKIEFAPLVSLCLVLREGAASDARTICSQVEIFVKTELFNLCNLYSPARLDDIMKETDKIVFDLDCRDDLTDDVKLLLEPVEKPKILLAADEKIGQLWKNHIDSVNWKFANDAADVQNIIDAEDIDLVLLDLWINRLQAGTASISSLPMTMQQFDHVPAAARSIARGQEILRSIHQKRPDLPCFLLSSVKEGGDHTVVDDELFSACVRSGGARGIIETSFFSSTDQDWQSACQELSSILEKTCRHVYRERKAQELGSERKTLSFDTAPRINSKDKSIEMRLRNLRLSRTVAAADISEVLQEVERPSTRFADVYGADAAKAELDFIVKWLKNPRQYKSMGLRPPRGILLFGAPGTGKTMLARSLAGECSVAFIVASAANFVTIWQGSGPQNVRDLFARARRYAPAIVFIDEIDAIGKKRTGGAGASAAAEQTLNALLTEMDGFGSSSAVKPVIVLAATNLVEILDDALRRRFDREIEVDKPDRAARASYLKRRVQGSKARQVDDEVIERLAGQSANMTIAELERVVELAARIASGGEGIITNGIIEEAFERMRLGEIKKAADHETLLRVARHEAGHCIIGWLRGEKPVQITIVARGSAGGFVEREADEERMLYTQAEIEARIRQAMGGRAAEIIYYGEKEGFTSGVVGDLRAATHYAELMVRDYGMGEGIGQVAIEPKRLADGPLAIQVMQSVEKIIKSQLDLAVRELQAQRQYLDLLVDRLMEENRLTAADLEQILAEVQ